MKRCFVGLTCFQVELLVLDCSPVMQGQITADTTVVVTEGFDLMDPLPSRLLRLCMSDFAHYADGLGEGRCLLDSQRLLSSGFCGVLQALECQLEVKVVDAQHHFGATSIDEDNSLFVSKQLLLQLGLFNHEWVKLWRLGGLIQRLVSVVVIDQIQSPEAQKHQEEGFISSTLWFNMTEGEQAPRKSFTLKMKVVWKPTDTQLTCLHFWLSQLSAFRDWPLLLWLAASALRVSAVPLPHRLPASFTFSLLCHHSMKV